jgi:hypothetical protein
MVLNGQRNAGWDLCKAIAHGFEMTPEEVFRAAGLLTPLPAAVVDERRMLTVFRRLDAPYRSAVIAAAEALESKQAAELQDEAVTGDPEEEALRWLLWVESKLATAELQRLVSQLQKLVSEKERSEQETSTTTD